MSALSWVNAGALRREHEILCMAERIAQKLVPEGLKYSLTERAYAESPRSKWMVLTGTSSAGLAINISQYATDATPLTHMIDTVKVLCQAGTFMQNNALEGLILSGHGEISEGWRVFDVDFLRGRLWIGVSEQLPWKALIRESLERYAVKTRVSCKVYGFAPAFHEDSWQLFVQEISVSLRDLAVRGVLRVGEGGSMSIEVLDRGVEGESFEGLVDTTFSVRLDLGEIEMSLAELAALRPGSVIELAHVGPLHCFLRIGTGEVRRGVVRMKADSLEVAIA